MADDSIDVTGEQAAFTAEGDEDQLQLPALQHKAKRILAFGGGKGGVGKSLLAANIGIYLAQFGKKVVLLDSDFGGANLHTFVGLERPGVTLGAFFDRRITRIEDIVIPTPIQNLGLLSGEGEPLGRKGKSPYKSRLMAQVRELEVDYLLVDLPPGSGFTALDFFLMADMGILVVVPEPTSVENTFRFIKSAFMRRLRGMAGLHQLLDLDIPAEGGIATPADLLRVAQAQKPQLAPRIEQEMRRFHPRLVVNQARTRADYELGTFLHQAGRRRLGLEIEFLGYLESDDSVSLAIRKRRPLVVEHPEGKATKNIERIARRILASEGEKPSERDIKLEGQYNYYELMDVDPGASEEDLRRAFRRTKEIFDPDSMAICGLYSAEEMALLNERMQVAYDTLIDPEQRRQYDLKHWPEGAPGKRMLTPALGVPIETVIANTGRIPVKADDTPLRPVVAEPEIGETTEFTGELLRKVREARGIELEDIADRTKINISHLRSLESERFDILPAKVYVRGFLAEYAKSIRLDPQLVVRSYMKRYSSKTEPSETA